MKTVYIQANNKQILGAKLAEFAIRKHHPAKDISIKIINVDDLNIFKIFSKQTYKRKSQIIKYDPADLQSFTLTRFMPPELNNFEDKAVVIDPDIFALTDIQQLFDLDMQDKAILACSKKEAFDSSVMLLDCAKLKHWKIETILSLLSEKKMDYHKLMTLTYDRRNVSELSRIWNSLDHLDENTKMLHTTDRLTQPWKTGLKIDFTRHDAGRIFGIIPRNLILKIRGKYPSHYQEHPQNNIKTFFFTLVKEALESGFISNADIESEIKKKNIRPDFMNQIL